MHRNTLQTKKKDSNVSVFYHDRLRAKKGPAPPP